MGVYKLLQEHGGRSRSYGGRRVSAANVDQANSAEIAGAQQWIDLIREVCRYGALPAHRKIAKLLREDAKVRFRMGLDPDGGLWPKTQEPPMPVAQVGKPGAIREDPSRPGGYRWVKVTSDRQLRDISQNNYRWFRKAQRSGRIIKGGLNPLYRGTGKHRTAGVLYRALTKDRAPGAFTRISKDALHYGINSAWTHWVGIHHWGGGTLNGKPVPKRELIGINPMMRGRILKIYEETYANILASDNPSVSRAAGGD